ncbi:hypothetical protein, partial [Sutterella wadsworthensis]|uniref:hypothetical protein n=1 Tax=Sutterella wadsworthensis TaxID=40545 RepID=UPI003967C961
YIVSLSVFLDDYEREDQGRFDRRDFPCEFIFMRANALILGSQDYSKISFSKLRSLYVDCRQ